MWVKRSSRNPQLIIGRFICLRPRQRRDFPLQGYSNLTAYTNLPSILASSSGNKRKLPISTADYKIDFLLLLLILLIFNKIFPCFMREAFVWRVRYQIRIRIPGIMLGRRRGLPFFLPSSIYTLLQLINDVSGLQFIPRIASISGVCSAKSIIHCYE